MRAIAVIDANYGDAGKGLITDYLCAKEGAGIVVRFNGGANAGHTVVEPAFNNNSCHRRHVFSHIGSGALLGVPTYLSKFFVCNPILFLKEYDDLVKIGCKPVVYVSPDCLVTAFADMIINQTIEKQRGGRPHGSCGVGLNETIVRNEVTGLRFTMADVWGNKITKIEYILREICDKYSIFRTGLAIPASNMHDNFVRDLYRFANIVHVAVYIPNFGEPIIFEGAQGLLLDQNRKADMPHLTRSNTGMQNVVQLCKDIKIDRDQIETYYVSRTYLTRHGAGPLPGEDPNMRFHDDTNVSHEFQGSLRFAPLDVNELFKRCSADNGGNPFNMVLTHCDQHPAQFQADLHSFGPTRNDVSPDRNFKGSLT